MTPTTPTPTPLVVVVGSVNLDVVTELDHLPRAGQTLIARSVRRNVGGKGANQAVAAQITCGAVSFCGRVGDDEDGRALVAELDRRGVATDLVAAVADAPSGAAYIAVADGQNTIVVAAGANGVWGALSDDERAAIETAPVVVCQLEIPDEVIVAASQQCAGRFVLNAAPARPVPESVLGRCDPVIVNDNELADLTGLAVDGPDSAIAAARELRSRGANSVVATLGAAGAVWVDSDGDGRQRSPRVEVVDSTGAGDQFVGALAARLATGDELADAVRWATAAASISVQATGTLESYPEAGEIRAAVEGLPKPSEG
ncbi:ribokinase [Williamsia phyllosphaerae]|uniref:Ribokinase n=1 Tax=Williamsia phyllosphaerae TaxID=885042 RepID=A0ABQ1V0S2_9NOCA|nr:ribokinase [Williamsia phyllosphaerae]GGF33754.1 ribokinase [Williamsia phyllosphaerae]